MSESEVLRCIVEAVGILLIFAFWGLSSRRFGAGVDTSLHPMLGGAGALVHIFFGFITAVLILAILLEKFVF